MAEQTETQARTPLTTKVKEVVMRVFRGEVNYVAALEQQAKNAQREADLGGPAASAPSAGVSPKLEFASSRSRIGAPARL